MITTFLLIVGLLCLWAGSSLIGAVVLHRVAYRDKNPFETDAPEDHEYKINHYR